jgi:hypothetical protein
LSGDAAKSASEKTSGSDLKSQYFPMSQRRCAEVFLWQAGGGYLEVNLVGNVWILAPVLIWQADCFRSLNSD